MLRTSFRKLLARDALRGSPLATPRVSGEHSQALLLVVNDELICELLAAILEQRGYSVLTAVDRVQALRQLRHEPVHLVLIDLDLPMLGGRELTAAVREQWPFMPVLWLSGAEPGSIEPGVAWLPKPFTFAGLLEAVGMLLAERQPAAAGA